MDASTFMLDNIDGLFAVWDGKPARGCGGTADVVHAAKDHGVPVRVIWPRAQPATTSVGAGAEVRRSPAPAG